MSAIGNCPWCGGEPDFRFNGKYYIHCRAQLCAASGPFRHTKEEAIAAWNRLATPGQGEVRGRVRWEDFGPPMTARAFLGNMDIGSVRPHVNGGWSWAASCLPVEGHKQDKADAMAALETAVREAINADPP